MTKEELLRRWDNMTNRERNTWVSEKVMGYKVDHGTYKPCIFKIPDYSTDIVAALEIIERTPVLKKMYLVKDRSEWILYSYEIRLAEIGWYEKIRTKTAPEAICIAALLAVMESQ